MREFWMRLMSVVVIVGLILGYNSVLEARAKDEEIAKLNAKIENVESLEDQESKNGSYLTMAKDIIPKILDAQSAEVDTISGATFSSTGIKNATKQALEKAVK